MNERGTLSRKSTGATVTPVAWMVDGELELTDWIAYGRKLGVMGRCSNWWLGDWIRYGNARFGERYQRATAITGYDSQSLMNMVWVASRFELSRRRENLTWSHHESVASLEDEEQERWLDHAVAERLSVADLRLEIRTARKLAAAGEPLEAEPAAVAGAGVCPRCGQALRPEPGVIGPA